MTSNTTSRPATLAVILAAGRGSRIEGLPEGVNKCALSINGDTSSVSHMVHVFMASGVTRFCVVVGYAASSVREALSPVLNCADITFVENPLYASTGCNYSLARATAEGVADDVEQVVVVEGDSLFPVESIAQMVNSSIPSAVLLRSESYVSPSRSFIALGRDGRISRFLYDPKHKNVLGALALREGESVLGESMDVWSFSGKALAIFRDLYLRYAVDVESSRERFLNEGFLGSLNAEGVAMRGIFAERPDDWINMNTRCDVEKVSALPWVTAKR